MAGKGEVIDTISKACAYGDFEKLQSFVQANPNVIQQPDPSGYRPLQWAALNNRVSEATYLLSQGAEVNATDQTGQTALHWACVRGSLPVIETLLRHSANPDARDNRGYTPAHVAAQYGQTAVLYHLALKWHVDIDTQDLDGRTPLHWAAYKGYADTIRLLLVLDSRCTLPDKEGCTPLHWAAIKGNGEACTVLLQGGSACVLTFKDVTGSTPAQLALEKGHRYLGMHLAEYKQKHDQGSWWKGGRFAWLTSTQLCPVIWLLGLTLMALFAYKVINYGMHPVTKVFCWTVMASCSIGLIFLYKTTTADPGFIPKSYDTSSKREDSSPSSSFNKSTSQHLLGNQHLKGLDSPALWAGHWHQLCVSCRIVRPLRAKHCAISDRCIEVFDHYCPWVGNAIGKGNRHYFIVFLWLELYGMTVSAIITGMQMHTHMSTETWTTSGMVWMVAFMLLDCFVGISVAALAFAQASQISRNVTTNELANWHRYKYLQTPDGAFNNPFNKGCWHNCWEVFSPHKQPPAPVYMYQQP